jgi:S-adenosylmethionine hydrolase
VAVGDGVALIGSSGFLEVSVRGGNAAEMTAAGRGASVVWSPE